MALIRRAEDITSSVGSDAFLPSADKPFPRSADIPFREERENILRYGKSRELPTAIYAIC